MSIFRTHILLPVDEGTVQAGVFEVKRTAGEGVGTASAAERDQGPGERQRRRVGKGVILAVYPERIYYFNVKPEDDVRRIIDEHLLKGRVVTELAQPSPRKEPAFRRARRWA